MATEDLVVCDECGFQAKNMLGLKIHKGREHKEQKESAEVGEKVEAEVAEPEPEVKERERETSQPQPSSSDKSEGPYRRYQREREAEIRCGGWVIRDGTWVIEE